jgi:hypothetical protein
MYSKRQEAEGREQKAKSLLSGRFILSLCPNLSLPAIALIKELRGCLESD